ncbi:MAG: hypothetical protein NWF05_03135 [Candidatus Bathyarchaeota archaeon]|nr:hypothetical protein [Candidatus Bathyarchaeota archaeon]
MVTKLAPLVFMVILGASFLGVSFAFAFNEDFWTTNAPMLYPIGTNAGRAAVLNRTVYVIGEASPTAIELYDPIADRWSESTPLSMSEGSYVVAACQNKIYVIGGPTVSGLSTNQAYDPTTDTWGNKAAMPTWAIGMQANVVDGKIYVIAGGQQDGYGVFKIIKSNWVYDPGDDSWSQMADIPTPVAFYASAVLDGKIYIIGGMDHYYYQYPPSTYTNIVQIFDPETKQWSQGTPLPRNMSEMAAAVTTGLQAPKRLYVVGGRAADYGYAAVNWTLMYDPETDNWSFAASMPTARRDISLVTVDDKLYALGGVDSSQHWLVTTEAYTPAEYEMVTPTPSTAISPSTSPTAMPSIPEFPIWMTTLSLIVSMIVAVYAAVAKKKTKSITPETV